MLLEAKRIWNALLTQDTADLSDSPLVDLDVITSILEKIGGDAFGLRGSILSSVESYQTHVSRPSSQSGWIVCCSGEKPMLGVPFGGRCKDYRYLPAYRFSSDGDLPGLA